MSSTWSNLTSVYWSHLYSWQTCISHVIGNMTNIYLSFKSGLIWQIFWKICLSKKLICLSKKIICLSKKFICSPQTHKFVTSQINLSHFIWKYRFVMQQNSFVMLNGQYRKERLHCTTGIQFQIDNKFLAQVYLPCDHAWILLYQ